MKISILNQEGKKTKEIETDIFSSRIREDILSKYIEAMKKSQPYAPFFMAGKQKSASGILKHRRHKWKTTYGHGISRVPRKIMWRRGDQFYWVGAEIASARGGRRAHPPRVLRKEKKINKKEIKLAFLSALSSTANKNFLLKRYESIEKVDLTLPLIIDESILKLKTKEFFSFLEKILGNLYKIALKERRIRAGKGKARGRKYKVRAGLLFVIGKDENFKISGIDIIKANQLTPSDIQLGRLCIYTERAVEELENFIEGKIKSKEKEK